VTSSLTRHAFVVMTALFVAACGAAAPPAPPEPDTAHEDRAPTAEALLHASWSDDVGFAQMPEPQPGEWLASFDEVPVSFDEYVDTGPVRAEGERHTLAFVPAGPFIEHEQDVMDATIEFCGLWFDLPTSTLPAMEVPTDGLTRTVRNTWTREDDVQVHTAYFLRQQLPRRLPDDAVTLVAVTMSDLYPGEGWNYVFGQALLRGRVGVYSLARHFPAFWDEPDSMEARRQALRRSLKLVSHEVGHTFGLEHCVTWRCNMNGSNSLDESDRAPLHLCPGCLRKLQWNRGFDVVERYERLRAFFEEYELREEAEWIASRLARIRIAAASVTR
jgi:archaemetzincin